LAEQNSHKYLHQQLSEANGYRAEAENKVQELEKERSFTAQKILLQQQQLAESRKWRLPFVFVLFNLAALESMGF